jgi:hypothetical protein
MKIEVKSYVRVVVRALTLKSSQELPIADCMLGKLLAKYIAFTMDTLGNVR